MTESEFGDYCALAPIYLKWKAGGDVSSDLAMRKVEWEVALRAVYGKAMVAVENEDELGG